MGIKLLESVATTDNDVLQHVDDGALINFQAAQQKNGLIYGGKLTNTVSSISIGEGLLMVRGYRLKIDSATTIMNFSSSAYPSVSNTYYLYLRISHIGYDAKYEWIISISSIAANSDLIEREEGIFDYKVASFTFGPSGIAGTIKSLMGIITSSGAGGSLNALGVGVPEPRLELVMSAYSNGGKGMTDSYLCLGNKDDYSKFTSNYSIKFVAYRYIQRGRYRNKNSGNKLYVNKTGFVKINTKIGWRKVPASNAFKLVVNYTDLQKVILSQKGSYKYTRTDVIDNLFNYIDTMFYQQIPDSVATPITPSSIPAYVRATRSKANGLTSKDFRHNYFKFAFKAELYDSAGKKVAESGLSRTVTIRPNRKYQDLTTAGTKLGNLFIITID